MVQQNGLKYRVSVKKVPLFSVEIVTNSLVFVGTFLRIPCTTFDYSWQNIVKSPASQNQNFKTNICPAFRFTVHYNSKLEKFSKAEKGKKVTPKTAYLCFKRCGQVFLTKEQRNKHELDDHLHDRYKEINKIIFKNKH